MNEILFIASLLFYFALVIVSYKLFGKTGLYVFAAFATIVSSLEAAKVVYMFGMEVTLGNAVYSSMFLVTDILSENHGKKEANTAVNIGIFTSIVWVMATQLTLQFVPSPNDFINESLIGVFGLVPRIMLSSIATFVISQKLDIFLYHVIWEKTGNGENYLWLRNNGSTLVSQLADSVIFTTLAFYGLFPINVLIGLIITTYVIKLCIALLDTPIAYLARSIKKPVLS